MAVHHHLIYDSTTTAWHVNIDHFNTKYTWSLYSTIPLPAIQLNYNVTKENRTILVHSTRKYQQLKLVFFNNFCKFDINFLKQGPWTEKLLLPKMCNPKAYILNKTHPYKNKLCNFNTKNIYNRFSLWHSINCHSIILL